ncbi:MAG TPA: GldG family protein [Candidatus Gemmiger excrementigallinarum]|uniref:GldG family protein n=1 Tax=Candidatus Gemmiger excrementigallinarum TaxID=2838609 RepID=A0A9D2ERZ8_9FIRM|nr:GldG family protein [Candidatus Gemmiger excrementigallinarum]
MKNSLQNKWQGALARNRQALSTRTAKVGGYSFVLSLVVLAILIAVNVLASKLPTSWTQFDISAAQLYSLTSDTKVVVTNLQQDVTIYWISQAGKEDTVIQKLLDRYQELSDHITVVKKDPDVYPTFAQQYTEETVMNNSLVVESGDKSRYISYDNIYQYDTGSYYTTGSVSQSFDGEGQITSAIDYVVSTDLPQVYLLSGHGEAALSETFADELERSNYETVEDFSLLNVDAIPEECDVLLINAPTSDISDEELTMLRSYVQGGGKLVVLSGPQENADLPNLQALLSDYGVTVSDGVVVDTNRDYYAFTAPYVLMPEIESSDITDPLKDGDYHVIVPIAAGLTVGEDNGGATVTSLLKTSTDSFSKAAGYAMTTYDKEDGDIDGPFTLAVSVEDATAGGRLLWVASDYLLDDMYNSYSSGANLDFVMNGLSWMIGNTDAVSIRSKSLDYNYLTISSSSAAWLKVCMIGIIPVGFLLLGLDEVLRRRKKV